MSNYNPTYLGEIELNEDTLAHFGVKGMKWGKRKLKGIYTKAVGRLRNRQSKGKRKERYVASHLADEITDGRRKIDRPYGDVKNDKYTDKYGKKYTWGEKPGMTTSANLYKSYRGEKVVKARSFKDYNNYGSGTDEYTTYKQLKNAINEEERRKKKK